MALNQVIFIPNPSHPILVQALDQIVLVGLASLGDIKYEPVDTFASTRSIQHILCSVLCNEFHLAISYMYARKFPVRERKGNKRENPFHMLDLNLHFPCSRARLPSS
jgi:hypothetical protein